MAYYLWLLGASLNLVPKYIPTLPEMPIAEAYRSPFARSNTRLFSIKHVGSLMWNKIPPYIQLLPNVRILKKTATRLC